jgi:pyrimidine-nucleoside phosphorylase
MNAHLGFHSFNAIQSRVISPVAGYISSIDSMVIGSTAVYLGAGRNNVEEQVDFAAGILLRKKAGMHVQKGDVLAEIYTERGDVLDISVQRVLDAFSFSDEYSIEPLLITHIVDKDGVAEFDQQILASEAAGGGGGVAPTPMPSKK